MHFRRDPTRLLNRQLDRVRADLARAREDLAVAEEQYLVFDAEADDSEVRAALEESVASARSLSDAQRQAELMRHQITQCRNRVTELEAVESEIVAGLGG
jgi:hypothetical protein